MTHEFTWDEADNPTIAHGDATITSYAELVRAIPELKNRDQLLDLCRALNHLWRGNAYRLIADPEAYRRRYDERIAAEDPDAAWQEGVVRLRDFGICDVSQIAPPGVVGDQLIFYVEDDYLGIPYRVTASAPDQPTDDPSYEPVPVADEA